MKRIFFVVLVAVAVAEVYAVYRSPDYLTEFRHRFIAFTSGVWPAHARTADHVVVRPQVINPIGVNTFLELEADPSVRERSLELIKGAGIQWVRQQFRWEEIERGGRADYVHPEFGTSTWEKYDHIVEVADRLGLELIARLDTTPEWARSPDAPDGHSPPEDLGEWERFVRTLAERYRGKVRHYQIWNEPNLTNEWGGQPVDPEGYTQLLAAAYQAIKEVDREAVVLTAALAPTLDRRPEALNELVFLDRMYDAGAADFFDVLSVNAYGLRSGPWDLRLDYEDVNFSRPIRMRELMVLHGDEHKPIWASEMGWNAAPEHVSPNPYGSVSPRLQADYTVQAFQRAQRDWPWMGVMAIWYFKRPDQAEQDHAWYYFRIMEPDFTPLPVYDAVKRYAREMGYVR